MGYKTTKNTISPKLKTIKSGYYDTLVQSVKLQMDSARNGVVDKTPVITGRLKGSLQGFGLGNEDKIFKLIKNKGSIIGFIGSKVEYAQSVEFTSKLNKGFFARGWNNQKKEMATIMKNGFKKAFLGK